MSSLDPKKKRPELTNYGSTGARRRAGLRHQGSEIQALRPAASAVARLSDGPLSFCVFAYTFFPQEAARGCASLE